MFTVSSEKLELRGIANRTTKKGNLYYLVNCETADGTALSFYCPDADAFASGLKKGDPVFVYFKVTYFDGKERLTVTKVEKAS